MDIDKALNDVADIILVEHDHRGDLAHEVAAIGVLREGVAAIRARAEAAETEARDACTAADEAEHRASLAIDSAQELARCVLQATQPQGSWVDHPPMGDWAGVVDSVSALRARAEAAEARAAQAEADARLMLAELYYADERCIFDDRLPLDERTAVSGMARAHVSTPRAAWVEAVRRILAAAGAA